MSFELKFFVCRHVSMWGFQNRVCPHPEKRYHHSFVNISPTLVIDTSMERSSRVLHHGNPKIWFFSIKFEFWLLTKSWNHLSFVNMSPTLVIDTSMERSSRVLHHRTQKYEIFSKSSKLTKLNSVRTPSFRMPRKKKSPWLRQYQSYISNWYVNGKVFTSTTTWEPKNLIFFFSKKFEIEFDFYFDLCWRAEIIQVGLNMHLYVDIGDASSSLWGSTSSFHTK